MAGSPLVGFAPGAVEERARRETAERRADLPEGWSVMDRGHQIPPAKHNMDTSQPNAKSIGPTPLPPPAPSRRRRRLWIFVGLLAALAAVVVLAPTLLSSRIGRPFLVEYFNRKLNGRMEVRDCSLGWTTGARVNGLVVFDVGGRQILQASQLTTGLTLLDVLRGRYNLRHVRADGLDVLLSREEDGSLNWNHLLAGNSASDLFGLSLQWSGALHVDRASVTYEDRGDTSRPAVFLRGMRLDAQRLKAGGPLGGTLSASAEISGQTSGPIQLNGFIIASPNRPRQIHLGLATQGMDAGAVARRLGPAWRTIQTSPDAAVFTFDQPASPDAPKWRQ